MSSGLLLTKSRLAGASLGGFYSITIRGGKCEERDVKAPFRFMASRNIQLKVEKGFGNG